MTNLPYITCNVRSQNDWSAFAVVVVNDESLLSVLSGLLSKAGLGLRAFTSAETALSEMSGWALIASPNQYALPALIVTDIYMPSIDGCSFCRLLRSPEYIFFNHIPILVISATFAGPEADRIVVDLGAEAFIPSPIDGKRFLEQIQAILSGRHERSPLRVLIVEDSKAQATIIKKAFAAHGYQVDIVSTVSAAIFAFRITAYVAAILDYHLPDGTGDTLLDAFRAERADCVCLMMTTDQSPELALNWIKRGAAAYLQKPFQPDYLIELCDRARRERSMLRAQDLLEIRTRELRESEERYRSIINACPDGIIITDLDGRLLMVSPMTLMALDCESEKEMLGRLVTDFIVSDERERASATVALTPNIIPSAPRYYLGLRLDGSTFHIEVNSALMRGIDGQPIKIVFVVRDISKRKQEEEEKANLQNKLRQAQKLESVGRLAGGISHDFNTCLASS